MTSSPRRPSRADVSRALSADVSGVAPPEGLIERLATLAVAAPTPAARAPWWRRAGAATAVATAVVVGAGAAYAGGGLAPGRDNPSPAPTQRAPMSPDASVSESPGLPDPTDNSTDLGSDWTPDGRFLQPSVSAHARHHGPDGRTGVDEAPSKHSPPEDQLKPDHDNGKHNGHDNGRGKKNGHHKPDRNNGHDNGKHNGHDNGRGKKNGHDNPGKGHGKHR